MFEEKNIQFFDKTAKDFLNISKKLIVSEVDALAPLVKDFNADTDWGVPVNGFYTISISAPAHGKIIGVTDVSVFEFFGNLLKKSENAIVAINSDNNTVTISVSEAPDNRFGGRVYVEGYGSVGAYTPAHVSNVELWLDMTDTSTLTHTNNSVSQINDKSGNNRHYKQPLGTAQALTGAATINGLNALLFDDAAGGDWYEGWRPAKMNEVTIFAIFKSNKTSEKEAILSQDTAGWGNVDSNLGLGHTSGAPGTAVIGQPTLNTHGPSGGQGNELKLTTTTYNDNVPHFLFAEVNGTNWELTSDSEIASASSSAAGFFGANGTRDLRLGGHSLATQWMFKGAIAEIVIFSKILTLSEKSNFIRNYVAPKYNVSYTTGKPYNIYYSPNFWADITDFSTLTLNGNDVEQVNDKSGNGFNLLPSTARPQYDATAQNGLPGIKFNAIDAALGDGSLNEYLRLNTQDLGYTPHIFIVAKIAGVYDNNPLNSGIMISDFNNGYMCGTYSTGELNKINCNKSQGLLMLPANNPMPFSQTKILSIFFGRGLGNNKSNIKSDGVSQNFTISDPAYDSTTLDNLCIGSLAEIPNHYQNCVISEILIYPERLPADDEAYLISQLTAKYSS